MNLSKSVDTLLDKLRQVHAAGQNRYRPIHGDLAAGQWVFDGSRLGLIDFDDFASGDSELDVATFLAELEFEDRPFTSSCRTKTFLRQFVFFLSHCHTH